MSLVTVLYIFSYQEFQKEISPYIKDLYITGNIKKLISMAQKKQKQIPYLWGLLNNFSYYPNDVEDDKSFVDIKSHLELLVTIIICSFCNKPDNLLPPPQIPEIILLQSLIKSLGFKTDINDLLLDDLDFEKDNNYKDVILGLNFKFAWLSFEGIEKIIQKIEKTQEQNKVAPLLNILKKAVSEKKGIIFGITV